MNFCWLTDIHLNFLSEKDRMTFYEEIKQQNTDAVGISGDIAEAVSLTPLLQEMVHALNKPIYFVLGNHDYYYGWIEEVKKEIRTLCHEEALLHWLPIDRRILLNEDTVLLGQDGWADGRYGNYNDSRIVLNDSKLIRDLFELSLTGKASLLKKMQELADLDAQSLKINLAKSLSENISKAIILTHVPPFKESCIHQGQISSPDWLPFFASKAMGDVILAAAQSNPAIDFLVLCGHTHSSSIYQALPNLLVKTGDAEYYNPKIQEVIAV